MKVAIVCDWLTGAGGAERVVLALHKMFPDAPIYTSQYNANPRIWYGDAWFSNADVRTSWLQWLPSRLKKFLPLLRAWHFSHLDLSQYDLVISSSGAEAKAIQTGPDTIHLNYCHAPTHYYWSRYNDYLQNPGFGRFDPVARFALKLLVGPLRNWDYRAAQSPDHIITNSNYTKDLVKEYYNRESTVVHPPVDVERFDIKADEPRRGFVVAGRQAPYKRIDLAVAACSQLNLPLVVIGRGPDHAKLKRLAGKSVTFLTKVDDEQVAYYFATSEAFIFPGVDDFGIVAVEAMAAGTPLIAYGQGGVLDYTSSSTGILFKEQSVDSLVRALKDFPSHNLSHSAIKAAAQEFSADHFKKNLSNFLRQIKAA